MKTAILTVALMLAAFSASANSDSSNQKCIDACNTKYTPEYLKCGEVVECQEYVKREAGICIKHCQ